MRVVAFVPDLMDRSRIQAVCPHAVFVSSAADLGSTEADLVVVDVSRPGAIDALAAVSCEVIAFAPHVDRDTLEGAAAPGRTVMARSEFFRRVAELLS